MKRVMEFVRRLREERGITGLETAIVLIAFVVVAAVFAFVVLSTGLFSSERSKETVYAGLAKTRGSMELTGGIIAESDTTQLTKLTFELTLAAGGDAVNLTPTDPSNRTVVSYQDENVAINTLNYTTSVVTGDSDFLLEQGELLEIQVDLTAYPTIVIGTNKTFTFEVKPPQGSYLVIQRTTPASVNQSVLNLN
jgi:flagellin FlaB